MLNEFQVTNNTVLKHYLVQQHLTLDTPQAHRIIKRLCKHFQHKVDVEWGDDHALIYFEEGICVLNANMQELYLVCEADNDSDLKAITDTMDRHIKAFCPSETFSICWKS